MKRIVLSLIIFAATFSACGPSKSEVEAKAKLEAIQDSIKTAADAANQDALKQQLINLKASYAAESSKLNDIQQFKILRTKDEKAQQIEEQTKVVLQLEDQIKEVSKQIRN